jgi:MtN3 and saliva related transmembrane protein
MPAQDFIGYAAATLTTLSFVPQAVLTLRTRNVSGISLGMYTCFTVGVALWLVYGIGLGELPIIVANAITLALATTILITKLRYGRTPQSQP